ncbi:MAG: TetR/AcrR family transcriptional regulator [Chloroflexi bacterium]|nr:TetR/AcrR family transcriptional regulator [Chloroflexota bacterium]
MQTVEEPKKKEKRVRLTEAAETLFYQQGVHRTTLADIAQEAEIPLGNVYYHFRTKEALIEAVIEARLRENLENFAAWEQEPDPRNRLLSFIRAGHAGAEQIAIYGCPCGSLSQEMGKSDDQLAQKTAEIFRRQLEWVKQQFCLLGKGEEASDLAVDLVSWLQGAMLLTHSSHSPDLLKRKLARMEDWLAHVVS